MELPANYRKAVDASRTIVAAIEKETETYGDVGVMGPKLFAEFTSLMNLDEGVLKNVKDDLVQNGFSEETASQIMSNIPGVAAVLIACMIHGQKP